MLLPEHAARGLVVGKFCPLHLGHERLIEFASTRCAQLLVIGWSQPGFAGYSAERRRRWLRTSARRYAMSGWSAPWISGRPAVPSCAQIRMCIGTA
jgi:FAD synthase